MFSEEDARALGLPLPISEASKSGIEDWEALYSRAHAKVMQLFLRLSSPPVFPDSLEKTKWHRMYPAMCWNFSYGAPFIPCPAVRGGVER
jgi:hypothetical protein